MRLARFVVSATPFNLGMINTVLIAVGIGAFGVLISSISFSYLITPPLVF